MGTATIYKNGIQLGAGTLAANATSITSYTATNSRALGTGRNVQIVCSSFASSNGVFASRVTNDGGSTITIAEKCPYA